MIRFSSQRRSRSPRSISASASLPRRRRTSLYFARRLSTADHQQKGASLELVTSIWRAARRISDRAPSPATTTATKSPRNMSSPLQIWEGSWEEGAVVRDREKRIFTNPDKVHEIATTASLRTVPGYHLCEPSPQPARRYSIMAGASGGRRAFPSTCRNGSSSRATKSVSSLCSPMSPSGPRQVAIRADPDFYCGP